MIRILVTQEWLKTLPEEEWEVIEMAQDGELKLYRLRPMLAKRMIDEGGQTVPYRAAMKQLGEIPLQDWPSLVIEPFVEALKNATVPKASGTPLNSPSAPASEVSASLPGSQP